MTENYILVPVAIRQHDRVQLRFPANITRVEAEKVARVILAYAPCDSGSGPVGEDAAKTAAEGEAPQSGDCEAGASPNPSSNPGARNHG